MSLVDQATRPTSTPLQNSSIAWLRKRLHAVVLLSGAVNPRRLSKASGRSLLDLPVDTNMSLLDLWHRHATTLVEYLDLEHLPVRVITDGQLPHPVLHISDNHVAIRIEQDAHQYRGTAGVLRDLAENNDDNDLLLVLNGAQMLIDPLERLVAALSASHSDVAIVSHRDGTPSGAMLLRCSVLRCISPVGFVDMKEQALPRIAQNHQVTVVRKDHSTGLPIGTLPDYIGALRWYHQNPNPESSPRVDAYAESWSPMFRIIETGAMVHDSSHIYDSVILRGACVETGAVVAQSLVCPGATVRRNQTIDNDLIEQRRGWRLRNDKT